MLFYIHSEMLFVIPVAKCEMDKEQNSDFRESDTRLTITIKCDTNFWS